MLGRIRVYVTFEYNSLRHKFENRWVSYEIEKDFWCRNCQIDAPYVRLISYSEYIIYRIEYIAYIYDTYTGYIEIIVSTIGLEPPKVNVTVKISWRLKYVFPPDDGTTYVVSYIFTMTSPLNYEAYVVIVNGKLVDRSAGGIIRDFPPPPEMF